MRQRLCQCIPERLAYPSQSWERSLTCERVWPSVWAHKWLSCPWEGESNFSYRLTYVAFCRLPVAGVYVVKKWFLSHHICLIFMRGFQVETTSFSVANCVNTPVTGCIPNFCCSQCRLYVLIHSISGSSLAGSLVGSVCVCVRSCLIRQGLISDCAWPNTCMVHIWMFCVCIACR